MSRTVANTTAEMVSVCLSVCQQLYTSIFSFSGNDSYLHKVHAHIGLLHNTMCNTQVQTNTISSVVFSTVG